MATHSSVLAWRIPGMGEPGGLPSMGSHRVGHDWSDLAVAAAALWLSLPLWLSWWRICLQCGRPGFNPWVGNIPWRREWLPTLVFWSREFHGLYIPRGYKELDTNEWLSYMCPCGSDGNESACNEGDLGSIPGSGRSPEERNGNPLQYSCLENSTDREAWGATGHKSQLLFNYIKCLSVGQSNPYRCIE